MHPPPSPARPRIPAEPRRPLTSAKGPQTFRSDTAPGRRSNWRAVPAPPLYRGVPAQRAAPFPEASRTFRKNPPQPPPRPRACACALDAARPYPGPARPRAPPPTAAPRAPARTAGRLRACAARNSREGLAPSGAVIPPPAPPPRPLRSARRRTRPPDPCSARVGPTAALVNRHPCPGRGECDRGLSARARGCVKCRKVNSRWLKRVPSLWKLRVLHRQGPRLGARGQVWGLEAACRKSKQG